MNALADLHSKMPGARPPKGPDSFVLIYKIFETLTASGVQAPPLRGPRPPTEILDPSLLGLHYFYDKLCFLCCFIPNKLKEFNFQYLLAYCN